MFAIAIDATPLGLFIAFLGGVVSILSPCVLPVLPGLIGVVSGMSISELQDSEKLKSTVIRICTFFSIGFSSVFIVIALATTELSQYFVKNTDVATRIGGFFLILFSFILLMSHVTNIRLFSMENRPFLKKGVTNTGAIGIGGAFAFGWSPCIGPILGGVLAYASTQHSFAARVSTILFYCLGLCFTMSFIVYSSFRYERFTKFLQRNIGVFTWIAILTMAFFGFILFFNKLTWITSELTRFLDAIGLSRLITIG